MARVWSTPPATTAFFDASYERRRRLGGRLSRAPVAGSSTGQGLSGGMRPSLVFHGLSVSARPSAGPGGSARRDGLVPHRDLSAAIFGRHWGALLPDVPDARFTPCIAPHRNRSNRSVRNGSSNYSRAGGVPNCRGCCAPRALARWCILGWSSSPVHRGSNSGAAPTTCFSLTPSGRAVLYYVFRDVKPRLMVDTSVPRRPHGGAPLDCPA